VAKGGNEIALVGAFDPRTGGYGVCAFETAIFGGGEGTDHRRVASTIVSRRTHFIQPHTGKALPAISEERKGAGFWRASAFLVPRRE